MVDLINLTALAPLTTLLARTDISGVIIELDPITGIGLGKELLSGALTANTYAEIVSLSTAGILRSCGVYRVDATNRTLGMKIVIDGTTVIDAVSAIAADTGQGWWAVGGGQLVANVTWGSFEAIKFNASLSISIKSSITETDKIALIYSTTVSE